MSVCRTLSRRAHEYHTTMHGALRAYQSSFSLLESHGSMSRGEMLEGMGARVSYRLTSARWAWRGRRAAPATPSTAA